MSERPEGIMTPDMEEQKEESRIVFPENMVLVLGGTIETSMNELLVRHVATARALERSIKAQHALQETMDRAVILMQDPSKTAEDAVRELTGMLSLQDQLRKERENLESAYAQQEAESAHISSEMQRLAKEHPELFVLASEPAVA